MSAKNHVTVNYNEERNGVELIFDEKPKQEILELLRKDHIFRWHQAKKLWYAKNTDRANEDAQTIMNKLNDPFLADSNRGFQGHNTKRKAATNIDKPNTFASYYTNIKESIPIARDGTDSGLNDSRGAYIEDLNIYYHVYNRAYDSQIQIVDLKNAQKRGKNCTKYTLSLSDSEEKDLICELYNLGIDNITKLWNAIKENDIKLDNISIATYEKRGVDVFSPFVEVKPLKSVPDKWTRSNFVQGLLSGQIYKGEVSYRYTDDYAYDAAFNFSTGSPLNLARTAQDVIENWYSTASISGATLDGDKTKATLHYSTHSNASDTLYFDLNFDHKKGQEYRIAEAKAIKRFNQSLKNSVIHPKPDCVDAGKVYEIQLIDKNHNNGIYDTKSETIQGYLLKEYLSEQNYYLEDLVGYSEMDIIPEVYYSVGLGYNDALKNDSRIIQADPHTYLVSGKALLEFSQEKVYLDKIREDYNVGNCYEKVKAHIQSFKSGNSYFMFTNEKVDYDTSLKRLETEEMRTKEGVTHDLDSLLLHAESRKNTTHTQGTVIEVPQRM